MEGNFIEALQNVVGELCNPIVQRKNYELYKSACVIKRYLEKPQSSIEMRAKISATRCIDWFMSENKSENGATDIITEALYTQRDLDIEEICSWLTKNTFRNVKGEYIHGGFIANELMKEMCD